jgi:hypothetical protein
MKQPSSSMMTLADVESAREGSPRRATTGSGLDHRTASGVKSPGAKTVGVS